MLRISQECGTRTAPDTIHYQTEGVNTSHEAEQIPQWQSGLNLTSRLGVQSAATHTMAHTRGVRCGYTIYRLELTSFCVIISFIPHTIRTHLLLL